MKVSQTRSNGYGWTRRALYGAVAVVLAAGLAWPVGASQALASGLSGSAGAASASPAAQAVSLAALERDDTQGSVLVCLSEDAACSVCAALGFDADEAVTEGAALSADGFSWETLMLISADAAAAASESGSAPSSDGGFLIVSLSAETSSADALVAWLEDAAGIVSVEADEASSSYASDEYSADATESADEPTAESADTMAEAASPSDAAAAEVASPSVTAATETADESAATAQNVDPSAPISTYANTQPISTYADQMWFLDNDGSIGGGVAGYDIGLNGETAGRNIVVAVLDSGFATDNPAIKDNLINLSAYPELMSETGCGANGYCSVLNANKTDVYDVMGHGTHIAGIIVSVTSNGGQTEGATILPVRVAHNSSGEYTTSALIRGMEFLIKAKKAGVNIIAANESLGIQNYYPAAFRAALKAMVDEGIVMCSAAGNSMQYIDNNPWSSGSYQTPGSLVVGSTNANAQMSGFSCYGKNSVSLMAPGGAILSTVPNGALSNYTSQLAYYNTVNNIEGTSRALLYEGFEDAGSTVETDICGGLEFTYGTVASQTTSGYGPYTVTVGTTPVEISDDISYLGEKSAHFGYSADTRAIVSRELRNDDVENPALLQAFNLYLSLASDKAVLKCGIIDETGKFYEPDACETSRACVSGLWTTLGSQKLELIPLTIRNDLASDSPQHTYRLAVFEQLGQDYYDIYLDSVAVGYGFDGYAVWNGTSMASPVVAGVTALAAAKYPADSATKRAARICGGVVYDEQYAEDCSTSGTVNVAGLDDPAPVAQTVSVKATTEGNVATLSGYFFGSSKGSVTINGVKAKVLSWETDGDDASCAQVLIPSETASGIATIVVESAAGKSGRTRLDLGNLDYETAYTDLDSWYDAYAGNLGMYSLGTCSKGSVILNYSKFVQEGIEDSLATYKFDLLVYNPDDDAWTLKITNANWRQYLGAEGIVTVSGANSFTYNDEIYFRLSINSTNSDEKGTFIYKYDFDTATFTKVQKLDDYNWFVVSADGKLYLRTTALKGSAIIPESWPDDAYTLLYAFDLETGEKTLVGGYSQTECSKLAEDDTTGENLGMLFESPTIYTDGRMGVVYNYSDCSRVVWADLSSGDISAPATLSMARLPYALVKLPLTKHPAVTTCGKFVVIAGAVKDGVARTYLFNVEDGTIIDTNSWMTSAEPTSMQATVCNNVLYVMGQEDTIANDSTGFFRSLDLNAWVNPTPDPDPTPTPTPSPSPSPSPTKSKATTSTGDNPLPLALSALAGAAVLTLAAAIALRKRRHRERRNS